jgi:NAD(P)H-dependent FMN reductase
MPSILVVTGSVRPNSVNEKVVPMVTAEVEAQGATANIADLKTLNLPFFDDPNSPTSPDFAPTHEEVKTWTQMVVDADGVVFVTPEYNHALSPVQQNAIDWIGKEWKDKLIGLVGYGWTSGAERAHAVAREGLVDVLGANVGETQANLLFMKHLNPDGTLADEAVVKEKIAATITELVQHIQSSK